jgi:ATP-dependent helicase Lhr and Lhr-like helicase
MTLVCHPPYVDRGSAARDLGTMDPFVLTRKVNGPRVIALAGRGWLVNAVDWARRKAYVEPADTPGEARWSSVREPQSFALTDAQRRVLLGRGLPGVELSQRAQAQRRWCRRSTASGWTAAAQWC